MTHQIYAVECQHANGESELCEVEQGNFHLLGELAPMKKHAAQFNRLSKREGWGAKYRAVPLPLATCIPEWFEYDMGAH